jgi:hypothetical protein
MLSMQDSAAVEHRLKLGEVLDMAVADGLVETVAAATLKAEMRLPATSSTRWW